MSVLSWPDFSLVSVSLLFCAFLDHTSTLTDICSLKMVVKPEDEAIDLIVPDEGEFVYFFLLNVPYIFYWTKIFWATPLRLALMCRFFIELYRFESKELPCLNSVATFRD
jgi:hypothetical protein